MILLIEYKRKKILTELKNTVIHSKNSFGIEVKRHQEINQRIGRKYKTNDIYSSSPPFVCIFIKDITQISFNYEVRIY